jgi:nucleoside-diphosphate-sugar epimerase
VRRALITGGAGFIGAGLARRLIAEGVDVDLVDDFSRAVRDDEVAALLAAGGVRVLPRDLRAAGALDDLHDRYDLVVHLAAVVGVAHVVRDPLAVLEDSVAMLRTVLAAARRQREPPRLLFASTSEVYAGTLDQGMLPFPTPEETPLTVARLADPRSAYMLAKIYGEAMCHQAQVPFSIVRPHNVYGPRMGLSHVIPELLQRADAARDGGELTVASVDHRRTFCFVDDAVEMLWRIASSPAAVGATFNVGTSAPEVTIGELAAMVAATVGKRLEIVPLPATPGSPPRRCPDMARTHRVTGDAPRVDLTSGLHRTYDWYRRYVFAPEARSPTAV